MVYNWYWNIVYITQCFIFVYFYLYNFWSFFILVINSFQESATFSCTSTFSSLPINTITTTSVDNGKTSSLNLRPPPGFEFKSFNSSAQTNSSILVIFIYIIKFFLALRNFFSNDVNLSSPLILSAKFKRRKGIAWRIWNTSRPENLETSPLIFPNCNGIKSYF